MSDPEKADNPKQKRDLTSYSAQRTFMVTMVAHFIILIFTSFMVYTAVPGSGVWTNNSVIKLNNSFQIGID